MCRLLSQQFFSFFASLKQQNLMKIMFSCIHFPVWPYPPKIMKKVYFILVNSMGWQVWDLMVDCSVLQQPIVVTGMFLSNKWFMKNLRTIRVYCQLQYLEVEDHCEDDTELTLDSEHRSRALGRTPYHVSRCHNEQQFDRGPSMWRRRRSLLLYS